jgi:hypothetical protein
MDEHNITAGLLVKLMSGISEERWCAGWMHNLEYMLWDGKGVRQALLSFCVEGRLLNLEFHLSHLTFTISQFGIYDNEHGVASLSMTFALMIHAGDVAWLCQYEKVKETASRYRSLAVFFLPLPL